MLLDMYPKGPLDAQPYAEGQDPFEIACWFDSGNYMIQRNPRLRQPVDPGRPAGARLLRRRRRDARRR